jgi:hypothetical protein
MSLGKTRIARFRPQTSARPSRDDF